MNDDIPKRVTAADVLRRYRNDHLPTFEGLSLKDVNDHDVTGDYPIHVAAIRGAIEDLVALIEGGAIVDAQGEDRYTALHYAAERGSVDAVKLLLKHGAAKDIRNIFGKRPIDLAKSAGEEEIVRLLAETGS